ncbi:MAG: hypothetical protein KC449_17755 [Anaerolineales bacterium]|nr:hypothetical protein [Anaerolineales bacterium]
MQEEKKVVHRDSKIPNIVDGLWNEDITVNSYGSTEQYREHVFEQYKIFVEMADRVSSRRNLANTFFLTLHTFLISAAGFLYEKGPTVNNSWLNIFPLIAVLALCYVWYRLLLSYRQLNSAKFKVIGEYEKILPSSPYWSAEWNAMGKGKNPKLYRPLTDVEQYVPMIFAVLYIGAFVMLLFT